jgi:hypothetical protein
MGALPIDSWLACVYNRAGLKYIIDLELFMTDKSDNSTNPTV